LRSVWCGGRSVYDVCIECVRQVIRRFACMHFAELQAEIGSVQACVLRGSMHVATAIFLAHPLFSLHARRRVQ
jgi:hypothetical protein